MSKAWLKASQPLWKSLVTTLKLISETPPQQSSQISEHVVVISLRSLRIAYDDPGSNYRKFPIRNYELNGWTIKDLHFINYSYCTEVEFEEDENDELFKWFWLQIAPQINSLTFTNCQFSGSFVFFNERFLRTVPNLLKLEVVSCEVKWEEVNKEESDRWLSLPDSSWYFSRLKKVKIVDLTFKEGDDGTIVWDTLFSLTTHLESLSLKGIDKGEGSSIRDDKLIYLASSLETCGFSKLKCLDIMEL